MTVSLVKWSKLFPFLFIFQAKRALYAALYILGKVGYFVSVKKSTLTPTQVMVHLGFEMNSVTSSFKLIPRKKVAFQELRESLLLSKKCSLRQMQCFVGKCQSLRLVFPAPSLFTRHCNSFISQLDDTDTPLPPDVLEEISFWRFLDSVTRPFPWRKEQHVSIALSSDASNYKWGATVHVDGKMLEFGDYWFNTSIESANICVKETMALFFLLQSLFDHLWDKRVDVLVDNEGLVQAWNGLRASSLELVEVLRQIFLLTVEVNCQLLLTWVPSAENPSDHPSRSISFVDSMLEVTLRSYLTKEFGPFDWDLMALPSNVMNDFHGNSLPFFSRFPMPQSRGVNVFSQRKPNGNLYVFPPFNLIPSLLRLFHEWGGVHVTMVIPEYDQVPLWWHALKLYVKQSVQLFCKGAVGSLLFPTKRGYAPSLFPSKFGLLAVKCFFPLLAPAQRYPPQSHLRLVLIIGDSILKPLVKARWPSSMKVFVRPVGGEKFVSSLERVASLVRECEPDALVLHSGVNDLSWSSEDSLMKIPLAFKAYASCLVKNFPQCAFILSSVCQTRVSSLNKKIAVANEQLEVACRDAGWIYSLNDAVQQFDLLDDVHLRDSGSIKLQRKISFSIRSACGLPSEHYV